MLAVVFIVAGGVLLIVLLVVGGVVRYKRGSQGPMRRPKNSFKLREPEDGSPQNSGKSGDPCSPAPKDRSKNPFKPYTTTTRHGAPMTSFRSKPGIRSRCWKPRRL